VPIDTAGNALTMPDNVRLFLLSNLQHAAPPMPIRDDQDLHLPSNPLYAGAPCALMVALDGWITKGTLPPEPLSQPDRGTLANPNRHRRYPKIPGVSYPPISIRPHSSMKP